MVEAAHEADLAVLAHAHSLAGIEHALAAGVDGIEHFTGLAEGGIRVPDEVLARTAAAGVTVDPTLGFDQAAFDALPAPPPGVLEAMRRAGMDPAVLQRCPQARSSGGCASTASAVVTGVDDGAIATKPHGSIALSVADLVPAGYPMAEALATATSLAAEACGLAEVTGSLRAGLAADVLVVDGDLSTGPDALRAPVLVLARGVSAVP